VEFSYYGPISEFQYSCGSDGTPHLSVTTQLQQLLLIVYHVCMKNCAAIT